jgi:hypothetical protein
MVVVVGAGARWVAGDDFGVVDLSVLPPKKLASPSSRLVHPVDRRGRMTITGVDTIAVGGIRSLATATRFVARRYASGAVREITRRVRRPQPPTTGT